MQKKIILKGAIIVLAASFIVRILGFFFRIYIADKLNAQGMGVYQLIISLYIMLATFATSGITFAVSRMVAESLANASSNSPKKILKVAVLWTILISVFVTISLLIFANQIGNLILREPRTVESIYFIAPGIPFMAVAACFKGYFFAIRKATHPSNSSIIEQTTKMIVTFAFLSFFLHETTAISCAMVSLGMTISEITAMIYLAIVYLIKKNKTKLPQSINKTSNKKIFSNMLKISIPIQFSSTFNAALRLIESVLIIECFKIFTQGDAATATSTYGIIKGMTLPLILFPTSFLQAMITILVPELSSANASKNERAVRIACEKSLQLTILIGLYSSAIFFIFPNKIANLFYNNTEVGHSLKLLSLTCPLMYVQIMSTGILNAIGEQFTAMKYNILEAIIRTILIVIFVPKGGFSAFFSIMYITNILMFLLYLNYVFKSAALPIAFSKLFVKPILAILIATIFSTSFHYIFNKINSGKLEILILSGITGIVFTILLFCFKCISLSWFNLKNKKPTTQLTHLQKKAS